MSDNARILVVEDDAHLAADIALRLQGLGYRVLGPVDTGEAAVRLTEAERPDLVLMDIVLPGGMDGIDTARRIARLSIPVIYMSSHADMEILERAKLTEPLGYLVKPYTERELLATVSMALYRSEVERELAEFRGVVDESRHVAETEHVMLTRLLNNLPGMAYRRIGEQPATALFEYVSAGCQALTGYAVEQLTDGSVDFPSLIDPADRDPVLAEQAKACCGDRFQVEYRITDADSQVRRVRETGYGVPARDGACLAWEGYITEI